MKTILIPTDFSTTANNAIEYGAKLAQKLNAKLEILNIQLLSAANPISSGMVACENIVPTSDVLKKMCNDINQTFNISCNYSIETTSKTLEKAISGKSAENTLIVMGTNGTDDLYQYIFGTNTYHVIKKSKCPVLMIPAGINYKPIKKIVFAWDYGRDNKVSFFQLKDILGIYDAEINFLHISKQKTPIGDDVFRALQGEIHSYLDEKGNITFERIYSEDPETFPARIDDYMDDSKADILAITFYDRGPLKNIFHGTITKELSETARDPLLVLHV